MLFRGMRSDRQAVEFFHLQFARLLFSAPDKDRFALKGGCNLRFFFESVRYSEDMDLDVARVPVHALKERVARLLEGPALALPLQSRGLAIREVSAPKQTETTQRWKIGLAQAGRAPGLHTKIEFSRRESSEESVVEPFSGTILAEYQMMPVLGSHYPLASALRQKVGALVGRSVVQARDVFDLAVLFARAGGKADALAPVRAMLPRALERSMDVSFADFKSQVVSFLKAELVEEYGTREAWDLLQARVVEALEKGQGQG